MLLGHGGNICRGESVGIHRGKHVVGVHVWITACDRRIFGVIGSINTGETV